MRHDALQELEALKRFVLKTGDLGRPRVLPADAEVRAVLVDAADLSSRNYVAPGALGDHDVSPLDDLADAYLRDLDPRTCATYRRLGEPFKLLDLHLDTRQGNAAETAATPTVVASSPATVDGRAHALLFWWRLTYPRALDAPPTTVSTAPPLDDGAAASAPGHHWRVAGVALNRGEGLKVLRGDVIDIEVAIRHSRLGVIRTKTRPRRAAQDAAAGGGAEGRG